jgi:hypothetical protein
VEREARAPRTISATPNDKRIATIEKGLEAFDVWLDDLARAGLASARQQPASFWLTPAARLVDAQAPGLARRVRELPAIAASGAGWEHALADAIGRIVLIREAFRRRDELDEDLRSDLLGEIGITLSQELVLAGAPLRDSWRVAGRRFEDDGRLRTRRTWLVGSDGQTLCQLSFAAGKLPFDAPLPFGMVIDADLALYPGPVPLRALVKETYGAAMPLTDIPGYARVEQALEAASGAFSAVPWLDRLPMVLNDVCVAWEGGEWWLIDSDGRGLPMTVTGYDGWMLLAVSGGSPATVVGEWTGARFVPVSVFADRRFSNLEPA